eukprot:g27766.t1
MGGDKAVRIRKRRKVFRCAARAVGKHLLRAKQGKQTPVRKAAAPAKHHLKPGKMIDPTPGNFTRSKKGEALIKQEATKLLQLDASLFPKKPAFDKISGECRLTQLLADGRLLQPTRSLQDEGLKDGDHLTAVVQNIGLTSSSSAFAAWTPGLVTWGEAAAGGDCAEVRSQLGDLQIHQVQATLRAFGAILSDGSVISWGDPDFGSDSVAVREQLRDVRALQASERAFAAILADESVVTWGARSYGGDCSAVRDRLRRVKHIQASQRAFAAMLADGSVVCWGHAGCGGDARQVQALLQNVEAIQSTDSAFAALLSDGSVIVWGDAESCGAGLLDGGPRDGGPPMRHIQASWSAFAGLREDGTVMCWGNPTFGGNCESVRLQLTEVQDIQASTGAFVAIQAKGSLVVWGSRFFGGNCTFQDQLRDVTAIQASERAFAAILLDGSVITWGEPEFGGDSRLVREQLRDVRALQASERAFAAILADESVVTWGARSYGGDCSAVRDRLRRVKHIQASQRAFAAMLADGSVVCWGDPDYGGDSRDVEPLQPKILLGGLLAIFAQVYLWGNVFVTLFKPNRAVAPPTAATGDARAGPEAARQPPLVLYGAGGAVGEVRPLFDLFHMGHVRTQDDWARETNVVFMSRLGVSNAARRRRRAAPPPLEETPPWRRRSRSSLYSS